MKRFFMLLLCLIIPVTFMIGCGEKKTEVKKEAEPAVEEATEGAAVDTTAAVEEQAPEEAKK